MPLPQLQALAITLGKILQNLQLCGRAETMEAAGSQSAHARLRSVTAWPDFVVHWDRLQKLDLSAPEMGLASSRLNLAVVGHIPVVRLKTQRNLALQVPKQASWKHLWLECKRTMDLEFEDISTFGKARSS